MDQDVEVGATDGDLRYWRAKEAIRHAELNIGSQTANLASMESRATSILGWAIAGVTVLVAVVITGPFRAAALAAAFSLFVATLFSILGLRAKDWGVVGYNPRKLLEDTHSSELEVLESFGRGYAETIDKNEGILRNFSICLTVAWAALAATPIVLSVIAYLKIVIS